MALDCSPVAIQMLQTRIAGTELAARITPVVADALQGLPAPDGHFDAVHAYLFFCLAFTNAELTRLFAECARVLKPDGYLAGTVRSVYDRSYGKGEQVEPDMFAVPNAVRHLFSERYLERKLTEAGFALRWLERRDESIFHNPATISIVPKHLSFKLVKGFYRKTCDTAKEGKVIFFPSPMQHHVSLTAPFKFANYQIASNWRLFTSLQGRVLGAIIMAASA